MTEAEKLADDIFYGRVYMCDKCGRKNERMCNNADCLKECERIVRKWKAQEDDEQLTLF